MAVPDERETPEVLIEFEAVGIAVPVATFHVCTVAVPASTSISQPEIVQAAGDTSMHILPGNSTEPAGSPFVQDNDTLRVLPTGRRNTVPS